jgi:hypothetical protein
MTATKTDWRLVGHEIVACNCDWNCPCEFNMDAPTHETCESLATVVINQGHYGATDLAGVKWAWAFYWPGPVHLGEGHRMLILDTDTRPEQRDGLIALTNGTEGHPYFEIFTSVSPHVADPVVAPISVEFDSDQRTAHVVIEGLAEHTVRPIESVVGGTKRIRLDMPDGFEFKIGEVANATAWHVNGPGPLAMNHERTYTVICPIDWSSDGTTR